jgi:hypothetical protein
MKLIIGKQYKITFDNGNSVIATYSCNFKGTNYTCAKCRKQRWHTYHFLVGNPENPSESYQYGMECIKHINIQEL